MRRQLQFNSHSLQTFDGIIQAVYENARHASDITEVKPTELTDYIIKRKEKEKQIKSFCTETAIWTFNPLDNKL